VSGRDELETLLAHGWYENIGGEHRTLDDWIAAHGPAVLALIHAAQTQYHVDDNGVRLDAMTHPTDCLLCNALAHLTGEDTNDTT